MLIEKQAIEEIEINESFTKMYILLKNSRRIVISPCALCGNLNISIEPSLTDLEANKEIF